MVIGEELASGGEHRFVYGARFPDLVADIRTPEPTGLVMPVSISVKNQGKLASGRSTVALYEGDPATGGSLIAKAGIPSLEPDTMHHAVINWPLLKKAGKRKLFVVADPDNAVAESNKNNNTVSTEATIPDLLLLATPGKSSFSADESIAFSLYAANLSATFYKSLNLTTELVDPAGTALSSEALVLTEFAPGSEKKIDRGLTITPLPQGVYRLRAQLAQTTPLAAVSSDISILPTLKLQGSFEGTPKAAALCRPFTLRYSIKNTGNLPVSAGALKLEIRSSDTGQPIYARQLPLTLDAKSILIEKMEFPKGTYSITLKASAMNQSHQITRDFMLAEQSFVVAAPINVRKGGNAIPRVLLWLGKNDSAVQQAVAEKIAQLAFDEDSVYSVIVDKAEDFTNQAMSGLFNTYVLFETNESLERADWLRDRVSRGQGLVIIGAEDRTRVIAEDFGFTFSEPPVLSGAMLLFTEDTGMGLSGAMPISGRMLVPRKKGAKPTALFGDDKKPAALIDTTGNGRVLVMPFSLSRSAVDTSAPSLYSLLLRTAVRSVAPETDEQATVSAQELSVSADAGPVKARIVVTVPVGAKIVWANAAGAIRNNAVTYELTADQAAQKLLFLYQLPAGGGKQPVVELFYECGGNFMGQGKIE